MSEKEFQAENSNETDGNGSVLENGKNGSKKQAKSVKLEQTNKNNAPSKEFNISIPRSEIEGRFDLAAEKYSAEMKLDGFRKGRIPVEVVKSKYREIIIDEVINKLIEEYTFKTIKDEKIPVISPPVIKKFEFEEGKDLSALVSVDLFPEVTIPDLEKITLTIKKDLLKSEKYDEKEQIKRILENNKRKTIVKNRAISGGDFVEFKIQSQFAETKRMMPKKDSFFEMEEKPHPEIGDIYRDLLGKQVGSSIKIERKYPDEHEKKNWAGKTIRHFIEINNIFEYVTPELDPEFLKSIGFQDESSFKSKLAEEYEAQAERHKDQVIVNEIREKLLDMCQFDVPDSIVNEEVRRSQSQYSQLLMTLPKDKRDEYMSTAREHAEKSIRFSFIIEEIKKTHNIRIENDAMEKEYKAIAEANNIDIKDVRKYYSDSEHKESLKDTIGRNRALELLKNKIKIKEV